MSARDVDPRGGPPFYVGKGKGGRALSHLSDQAESKKRARIEELRALGLEPQIEILAHGLKDEATAFRVESAVIDLLVLDTLTNFSPAISSGSRPVNSGHSVISRTTSASRTASSAESTRVSWGAARPTPSAGPSSSTR